MKIEKYFDLEFLGEISKNAEALQKLCNEDNGFIFKRLQDSNILPDKEIVKQVESHMAIIFLFKNYKMTDEDYIKYSLFLIDGSTIMQSNINKNNISKRVTIDFLFNKNKGFILPDFLLNKDDFIKYENLITTRELSQTKKQYLIDSFLFLDQKEVEELPLSIFSIYPVFYNSSSHYLFNNPSHLEIFKSISQYEKVGCDFTVFIEYIKRVNDISFLNNLRQQNEENLKKIYFIFKESDENFTINDMFPYVCKEAKLEIIKNDYTGDFNPQILIDIYLNNTDKLREDFGWNYKSSLENLNLPPILRHYLLLHDALLNKILKEDKNSEADVEKLINLLKDNEKMDFIDLSKVTNAYDRFDSLFLDYKNGYHKNNESNKIMFLPKEMLEEAISLYCNKLFKKNNSFIDYVPLNLLNIVYEHTTPSLNKFIYLSHSIHEEKYKVIFRDGIKELPLEFQNDLLLLATDKDIPLSSPLFKADCLLKIKEIDSITQLNKNHLKILNEQTILNFLSNGALIEDDCWDDSWKNFTSEYNFSNFQLEYLKKNKNNKNNGPILIDLIKRIQQNHPDSDVILENVKKFSEVLTNLFTTCSENLEYINNDNNNYINFKSFDNKNFNNMKNDFKKLSDIEQNKIIKLIKPNNFFENVVFSEAIGQQEIFDSYIVNQFKKNENQRDLDFSLNMMMHEKSLIHVIENYFMTEKDITIKENMLIYAIKNLGGKDFYDILQLIDFNNPKDNFEEEFKGYIIENYSDKLLFNNHQLSFCWKYNMEDLYNMFQCLDNNNKWNFPRNQNTGFIDYMKNAITNSSKDMFWQVLDKAKTQSPSIYTMLVNSEAIHDKMFGKEKFLSDEFNIFKEDYFKKNSNEEIEKFDLSQLFYIYDFIDLDIVAKGINSIRNSFSKNISNYNKPTYNENIFSHFNNLYSYGIYGKYETYLSPEKINSFVNNLIEADISNINIILFLPQLIEVYGKDNFKELIIKSMDSTEYINSIFLRELSSTYRDNKKIACYRGNYIEDDFINFHTDLFDIFAQKNPKNALFLSYLCTQESIFYDHFKVSETISLKGNFESLEIMSSSKFGSNIHDFAKDFYTSSELNKKIKKEINKTKGCTVDDIVFKL